MDQPTSIAPKALIVHLRMPCDRFENSVLTHTIVCSSFRYFAILISPMLVLTIQCETISNMTPKSMVSPPASKERVDPSFTSPKIITSWFYILIMYIILSLLKCTNICFRCELTFINRNDDSLGE